MYIVLLVFLNLVTITSYIKSLLVVFVPVQLTLALTLFDADALAQELREQNTVVLWDYSTL